ncbi:hypothetical protein [Streptomyces sp. CBMA156]|uniref:hypothetical protein n=1 Tax=Streptomyces sp. CBMA156 TaxID=1930280 RepID=UPI001661CB98|nr:hypothetical protein [Streptomyces sp. CBMA156]MBD0673729.1 hypothetical protein [Streptomyces sp. CBMA156]
MSNSYAQPILRTADLEEALQVAARLLELADTRQLEVDVEALVDSVQALEPLMSLLPDAEWWAVGGGNDSSCEGDSPVDHLPVRLRGWGKDADMVRPLLAAAGSCPMAVRWDFLGWPEAPDIGLGAGGPRGAYVTVCANARDVDLEKPAADHTVFVHVKQAEAERAPWLAARVGLKVIGELVMAPW